MTFLRSSSLRIDSLCLSQSPDARIVGFSIDPCDEFVGAYVSEEGLRHVRSRADVVIVPSSIFFIGGTENVQIGTIEYSRR